MIFLKKRILIANFKRSIAQHLECSNSIFQKRGSTFLGKDLIQNHQMLNGIKQHQHVLFKSSVVWGLKQTGIVIPISDADFGKKQIVDVLLYQKISMQYMYQFLWMISELSNRQLP